MCCKKYFKSAYPFIYIYIQSLEYFKVIFKAKCNKNIKSKSWDWEKGNIPVSNNSQISYHEILYVNIINNKIKFKKKYLHV